MPRISPSTAMGTPTAVRTPKLWASFPDARGPPETVKSSARAPAGDDRLGVSVRAHERGEIDAEQAPRLLGDAGEDLFRGRRPRNERRHPPQRLLFASQLLALGDVLHRPEHPQRSAIGVPGHVGLAVHVAHNTIREPDAVVDVITGTSGDRLLVGLEHDVAILRVQTLGQPGRFERVQLGG